MCKSKYLSPTQRKPLHTICHCCFFHFILLRFFRKIVANLIIASIYFFLLSLSLFFSQLCYWSFGLVYKQGNLPVALIFDYPENSVKQEDINMLSNEFGVYIVPRHKQRQSTLCIVIKGIEKFIGNHIEQY